jgi:hypothetical protein
MSMKMREQLEAALLGAKYCFKSLDGKYPEIDKGEFYGTAEDPGFLDFMMSLLLGYQKKGFFDGYAAGSSDACHDLSAEFNEDLSKNSAWKRWDEIMKEGK